MVYFSGASPNSCGLGEGKRPECYSVGSPAFSPAFSTSANPPGSSKNEIIKRRILPEYSGRTLTAPSEMPETFSLAGSQFSSYEWNPSFISQSFIFQFMLLMNKVPMTSTFDFDSLKAHSASILLTISTNPLAARGLVPCYKKASRQFEAQPRIVSRRHAKHKKIIFWNVLQGSERKRSATANKF